MLDNDFVVHAGRNHPARDRPFGRFEGWASGGLKKPSESPICLKIIEYFVSDRRHEWPYEKNAVARRMRYGKIGPRMLRLAFNAMPKA